MRAQHVSDLSSLFSDRSRAIDASGIRRIFELGATLENPYNFSIGQPDFPVPEPVKRATIDAIERDANGYTVTQGIAPLLRRLREHLEADIGWSFDDDRQSVVVTSGTSGALVLTFMAMMNPGDEAIIADPYFVLYPHLATLVGGKVVLCDTYPDFRLTADRVEPLITERTKILLVNSPGNPTGSVIDNASLRDLVALCEARGVLLVSDEIYDTFTYPDAREDGRFPSPARFSENLLLVRGFGKSYGCTGWRLGYAAGPRALVEEIAKLQQYTYVCAPSMAQHGALAALDTDISSLVDGYATRRDLVVETLGSVTDVTTPGGAFYAFVKVPARLGLTGTAFVEEAIRRNVLIIPGGAFSRRDTHFRLSFAVSEERLRGGLEILRDMMS